MNVVSFTTNTLFILITLFPVCLKGQIAPELYVKKTTETIVIDGLVNEKSWYQGTPAKDFWQYFPSDSISAKATTEIFMTYDEDYLYVAAKCYSLDKDYIIPDLRRDFRAGGNDNVTFLFDTFDDQTNTFFFGMNPAGVKREGLISNGGTRTEDFTTSWDNKWKGVSKIYDRYWICELAIPFKTLRFKSGGQKWRFNSYRFDTQANERSTWVQIPRNQLIFNLAFMGDMVWEKPLGKSGKNFSVIPYATAGIQEDFETTPKEQNAVYNIGGDAKIGITSGLNLDLTINPDFSQVEVDRQVTDLNRFEIFFPERRQFFLENADLFSSFGARRINPFFSRRIGIATDAEGNVVQNQVYAGARLSGKLDNNWRIGLLNMQAGADDEIGLPSFNYTVAAVQRKLFTRSNIGMIFVNRETLSDNNPDYDAFNRVIGADYNLASSDNTWTGKAFYHRAITPADTLSEKGAHGVHLNYRVRKWRAEIMYQRVAAGFDPQVGFLPRKDYFRYSPELEFFFYPKKGKINQHSIGTDIEVLRQIGERRTDQYVNLFWNLEFTDNSRLRFSARQNYIYLTDGFDPSGLDSISFAEGTDYNFYNFSVQYNSDRRKRFIFSLSPNIGQYFNGERYAINGNIMYQIRPLGAISLDYSYNYIQLPTISSSLVLLGPRIDITFSKSIFLTTFFQYNNQTDNFNINARLQWRFQPVSDFFLVYTDNYYASDFTGKNRAIVAKFTYWLNP